MILVLVAAFLVLLFAGIPIAYILGLVARMRPFQVLCKG